MCELNVSKYVRKRMKKRKKKSASNNTRVYGWVVMMMMVCEHKAHSWSVSCPSFSFFFFLSFYVARFVPTLIHILPPTTSCALLFAFFFYAHRRASASCRAKRKSALVFSFLSLVFFFFSSLSFSRRPYGRIRRRASLLYYRFSE